MYENWRAVVKYKGKLFCNQNIGKVEYLNTQNTWKQKKSEIGYFIYDDLLY